MPCNDFVGENYVITLFNYIITCLAVIRVGSHLNKLSKQLVVDFVSLDVLFVDASS